MTPPVIPRRAQSLHSAPSRTRARRQAMSDQEQSHYRICPLCEACCGLEVRTLGEKVISIRGAENDVFSHGYLCPKGVSLKDLHEDPDRLRTPLVKRDGVFVEASWPEALAEVQRRLLPVIEQHGRA